MKRRSARRCAWARIAAVCTLLLAAASAHAAAARIYTYVDREGWFDSRSLVVDDGREVTLIGATASPTSARRLLEHLPRTSTSTLRRVVIDGATIEKAGGIAAFAAGGIEVWAAAEVASQLPSLVEHLASETGGFSDDLLALLSTRIATFERRQVFRLAEGRIEFQTIPNGCNANANTVARIDTAEGPVTYVGAIIQPRRHPWFGGRLKAGRADPDLNAWVGCIKWLIDAGQLRSSWASDEGVQHGAAAADEFIEYLQHVEASARRLIDEKVLGSDEGASWRLLGLSKALVHALRLRYPNRLGDPDDMVRSLLAVLEALHRRRDIGRRA